MLRFPIALAGVFAAATVGASGARCQVSDDVVRIGVLNDQSGLYADLGGPGSVVAARMAVEDVGGTVLGKPVEIVVADHQNKADIGAAIARRWFDAEKVDMAIGFDNSSVALAVEQLAAEHNRIAIAGAVGSTAFTGKACTPTEASWIYDSYALTTSLARSVVAEGRDTWFFLTVDYAFGHSLEADATSAVLAAGGKVLGSVRHPLNTADFSSYLLQAQASGAKVVALANGGGDMINAIKQANEFGLTRSGQTVVSLLVFISDVHSIGLQTAQGLKFATAFYWDRDEDSRAWSKRFFARHGSDADHGASERLFRYPSLSQSRRRRRHGRSPGGHGQDAGASGQRFLCPERPPARRRPACPRHVFRGSQEAFGIEGAVGRLQNSRRHSWRQRIPLLARRRLSAGETLIPRVIPGPSQRVRPDALNPVQRHSGRPKGRARNP